MNTQQAWKSIQANLNRSLFDGSPFVITDKETRAAHRTLMQAPPKVFLAIVIKMSQGGSTSYLNRYISEVKQADGGYKSLKAFALRLARLENSAKASHRLIKNLQPSQWRDFVIAFSSLTEEMRKYFLLTLGTGGNETWNSDDDDNRAILIGVLRMSAKTYAAALLHSFTSHKNKIAMLSTLAKALTVLRLFLKPSGALGMGIVWGNAGASATDLYQQFSTLLSTHLGNIDMISKHDSPLFQRAYQFVTNQ